MRETKRVLAAMKTASRPWRDINKIRAGQRTIHIPSGKIFRAPYSIVIGMRTMYVSILRDGRGTWVDSHDIMVIS